jgi:zinc transporter 2
MQPINFHLVSTEQILGTLVSIFTIWAITAYLVVEAVHRFMNPHPHEVMGKLMFMVACCGLVFNVI